MSTPRRRRRDREPLPEIVGTPATVPNATGDIRNAVEHVAIEPTHEDIARRAYQLFEDRGGEHGHDWDDWLQAERELRDEAVVGVFGRILAMGGPYATA
ncbi:MAG: DUF2934 domain-containing protein [Acidobacteria bacterium]|nr:MAG: DUF2934 domain-containing protein [Acidobacteriota bacterium]PYR81146.1 MAG: DUF2934 domain-containing protein [Acidobacteriota bacterium]TLZ50773.1 MAG: DUF2934 domain-containing protein [Gammaproteobacteria bacterium]